jgi:hypothetical protein
LRCSRSGGVRGWGSGGSGELFGLVAERLIMIIAPRQWIRSGGANHPTRCHSGQPPSASSRDPCALNYRNSTPWDGWDDVHNCSLLNIIQGSLRGCRGILSPCAHTTNQCPDRLQSRTLQDHQQNRENAHSTFIRRDTYLMISSKKRSPFLRTGRSPFYRCGETSPNSVLHALNFLGYGTASLFSPRGCKQHADANSEAESHSKTNRIASRMVLWTAHRLPCPIGEVFNPIFDTVPYVCSRSVRLRKEM